VGYDALPESEKGVMDVAKMIREDYLQQSAYDAVDTYSSIRKQYLMIRTILNFGHMEAEAVKTGAQASQVSMFPVKSKISKIKWTPEDQVEAFIQEIEGDMAQQFSSLRQEIKV
jgi:V/A-type H+/Na+-transporting ATPase subunit A